MSDKEIIAGYEKFKDKDKWVEKLRAIDREHKQYEEVVVDLDTGEIIHQCQESLTDYFGHGSANLYPIPERWDGCFFIIC